MVVAVQKHRYRGSIFEGDYDTVKRKMIIMLRMRVARMIIMMMMTMVIIMTLVMMKTLRKRMIMMMMWMMRIKAMMIQ